MKYCTFLLLFILPFVLNAQGALGIRTERWAGISGATLNPAATTTFPKKWEIQLAGAHFFGHTNYLFAKSASVPKILRFPERVHVISDTSGEKPIPTDPILVDFPKKFERSYGAFEIRGEGPGFALHLGDRQTIGLFSAFRAMGSGYRIPATMGYTYLDTVPHHIRKPAGSFLINGMAWLETGLHYAWRTPDLGYTNHSFGVNLKYLKVMQAGFAQVNERFDYIREDRDTLTLTNGDWDLAFTNDIVNDYSNFTPDQINFNGSGFGLDLGYQVQVPDLEGDDVQDYRFTLGVSLTDLGYATINKRAETHKVRFDDSVTVYLPGFEDIRTGDEAVKNLSNAYLGDSSLSLSGNSFTMILPAKISMQADYKIMPKLYLNGVWIQRLPFTQNSLRSPNLLAFTPRYETRWFSAFLPFTLSDYDRVYYGLALRLGVLTVGTDHLGSMLRQKRLNGTDFYFNLKVNAFTIFRRNKGLNWKNRNWNKVGCYHH